MACQYRPWTTYTVRQNWTLHVIIAIEPIIWSDDVERGIPSSPLDNTQSDYIGRDMPSRSMGSTHARKTSGIACQNPPWTAHEER